MHASRENPIVDDDVELMDDDVPLIIEDVVGNANNNVRIDIDEPEVETEDA